MYSSQIKKAARDDRENKLAEYKRQISQLRDEEARLGRLLISNKISEETYDKLRKEWKEKQHNIEVKIGDLQREASKHLDDLDVALALMSSLGVLYERLSGRDRSTLLQVIIKKIIVEQQGEVIDLELNPPFAYLQSIAEDVRVLEPNRRASYGFRKGAHKRYSPNKSGQGCYLRFENL